MTVATRRGSRQGHSEEAVAAARVVLGLTVGVGAMAAMIGAAHGEVLAIVGIPTAVLLVALVAMRFDDRAVPVAGLAATAVWALLLPHAHAEAMLGPLAMGSVCLAIALGPERLLGWIGRDFGGGAGPAAEEEPAETGWIEES